MYENSSVESILNAKQKNIITNDKLQPGSLDKLVSEIKKKTLEKLPEFKGDEDLEAVITHWFHNRSFRYKRASDELISIFETALDAYDPATKRTENESKSSFDFVDLFAGIGGFHLALQSTGGNCVFASEWDKAAKRTYFNNHGLIPFGDINNFTNDKITDLELKESIPDHKILAAGFPCQPFSLAGVSARNSLGQAHGFECETQGTLFHSVARIALVKQPEVVFLENVKNIVSHDKGNTFRVVRETMENLAAELEGKFNYKFHYSLVNSQTLVAQRRIRCFMVCIREDIYEKLGKGPFIFPSFEGSPLPLANALDDLSEAEELEYTISDKLWQGHINRTKRNLERNTGFTAFVADTSKPSNTIVARYGKDGKECLVPSRVGGNPRKLTKNECARLFGYPTDFWIPEAKTTAYKQFGNSVVVPVVSKISKAIVDYLTP